MTQSHDQEPPAGEDPAQSQNPQPAAAQPGVPVPGFEAPPAQTHPQQPAGYVYQVQPTHSYDQPAAAPQPGAYGYPVAPPMPYAPQVNVTYQRPGGVTAAAVLAYVQAGITGIAVLSLFSSLFEGDSSSGDLLVNLVVVLATSVGVGLLIAGGVQLAAGRGRRVLVAACLLQFAICLYYIIFFATLTDDDLDPGGTDPEVAGLVGFARGVMVMLAIVFAVMPTISLALAQSGAATGFLQSRRSRTV